MPYPNRMKNSYKTRGEIRPRGLDGISEEQIAQHWALYEGYVKNVNLLGSRISALSEQGDYGPEFAELVRRLGFEYDGMLLHERYFEVLRRGAPPPRTDGELMRGLERDFGGFERWKREFTALAGMRGVGWAILYCDPARGALSNHWISLHESGHPAGFAPVLVLDLWEHAYMVDRGSAGRQEYVASFFKNVDWTKAEANLREASRPALAGRR